MRALILCVVLLPGLVTPTQVEVKGRGSPVQKVIQMMSDMMAKAKMEKQDEKVRFAAFSQFCKSTLAEKKAAIEKSAALMESAEATMAEADAAASALAKEISGHAEDMDSWAAEEKKATSLREEQHALYKRTHAETVDSIDSTKDAEATLQEGNQEVAQAALLQLSAKVHLAAGARQRVVASSGQDATSAAAALLQDRAEMMGTPEASAYEGSSGAVVEVVHSLEDKLNAEKKELEEREGNQLNAYNLQVASIKGDIKKAQMETEFKASMKAQREQESAAAKGELADATAGKEEDSKFLADLTAECELKTADFHKRQAMRKGEVEAISKAIEIMSDVSLTQRPAATALAQLRSAGARKNTQHIASSFLASKAAAMKSRALSLLATRVKNDPFGKVVKMIKDMIQKLMEEANEEAEHKGFCDTEMGMNKMTRDAKSAEVSQLQATIEELTADINKLAQMEAQIQAAITEVDAAFAKATSERKAEKAKNQATIEDSKAAQAATQKAIQVLKEYYEAASNQVELPKADGPINYDPRSLVILKAAGGGAFVQQGQQKAPEMESGKYTGQDSGGIVGLLEVIESDFAGVISTTESSESEAVRIYEQFSNDSSTDKAVKNTELKHQQDQKTSKMSDLQEAKGDLKAVEKELQAAMDYFEKLKPNCVEVEVSYEDRVAARKAEIESLQEALTILSGDDIA